MSTTVGPALGQGAVMNQATSYDAISARRFWSVGREEGVISSGSFAVTQRGAGANLSVDVAASTGDGAMVRGDAVTSQGLYLVAPHASVINEAITAAHATLPRNDLVILEVKDTAHDASGSSLAQTRVVAGTATAGAASTDALGVNGTPTLPNSAIPLAVVNVPALAASITNANIDDRRPFVWRGGSGGKSIIATEEVRSASPYATLTTPDIVKGIVLPTDGLICVAYQAMWKESIEDQAKAAIFVGATQLKRVRVATAPQDQEAGITDRTIDTYASIFTSPAGLEPDLQRASAGSAGAYVGDATTGQVIGGVVGMASGGAASESVPVGGPCYIFAAAGTYDISVKFRAVTGSVTVKNRKLWVWTMAFG